MPSFSPLQPYMAYSGSQLSQLGTTTLAANATTISIAGLVTTSYKTIMVILRTITAPAGAGAATISARINADAGANYSYQLATCEGAGAGASTASGQTSCRLAVYRTDLKAIIFIDNIATLRKRIVWESPNITADLGIMAGVSGFADWNNTTDTLTGFSASSSDANGLLIGTHMEIYGIT